MKNTLQKILICSFLLVSGLSADINLQSSDFNYFKSKKIDIDLGAFKSGLKVRLEFEPGHGRHLFDGFKGLAPKIVQERTSEDKNDGLSITGIAKVFGVNLLQNKIKDFLKNGNLDELLQGVPPYAKWFISRIIKNGKLTPTDEFILKTYMLWTTDLGAGYENLKTAEFLILVVKLINSNVNFDINKINGLVEKLSEYFDPEFISFVKELLNDFKSGFKDIDFENIDLKNTKNKQQFLGYVFENQDKAQAFYNRVNSVSNLNTEVFKGLAEKFNENYGDENNNVSIFDNLVSANKNNLVVAKDLDKNLEQDKSSGVYLDSNTVYCVTNNSNNNLDYALLTKSVIAAIYHAINEYKELSGFEFKNIAKSFDVKNVKTQLHSLDWEQGSLQSKIYDIDKKIEIAKANISKYSSWYANPFNKQENLNRELANLNVYEKAKQEAEKELVLALNKIEILMAVGKNDYSQEYFDLVKGKSLIEVFKTMFSFDNNFSKIFTDILKDEKYKTVRINLFNRLAAVSGNFELVKEYWPTIEYVLENKFPELKTEISSFDKNIEEEPSLLETSFSKLTIAK